MHSNGQFVSSTLFNKALGVTSDGEVCAKSHSENSINLG